MRSAPVGGVIVLTIWVSIRALRTPLICTPSMEPTRVAIEYLVNQRYCGRYIVYIRMPIIIGMM